jgi:hypothetical protein
MGQRPDVVWIYHITDLENLPKILDSGGLLSDKAVAGLGHTIIGHDHIKLRRLTEIRVPSCEGAFVGEFVPFYFCPRSPMLFAINRGNTGRPAGCQRTIVHLVSKFEFGASLGRPWAISDGNAGAFHAQFLSDASALDGLDWEAIKASDWRGKQHQKQSEFLVKEFFPWDGFIGIGCFDANAERLLQRTLDGAAHVPKIAIKRNWYY